MSEESLNRPLDRISTLWSVVRQAHGDTNEAVEARHLLLLRYGSAARRYLLGASQDLNATDDLFQEFSLRLLRGDLRNADPGKGPFRRFVKGILIHLVADHNRLRGRVRPLASETEGSAPDVTADLDGEFLDEWRKGLLARAWEGLEQIERQTGQPFHAVLRLRADHSDLDSGQLAEKLSARLGKSVTAAWVRQNLHRAREKYAEFLVAEVVHTLAEPDADALIQELIELDLYTYCQAAAERFRAKG